MTAGILLNQLTSSYTAYKIPKQELVLAFDLWPPMIYGQAIGVSSSTPTPIVRDILFRRRTA